MCQVAFFSKVAGLQALILRSQELQNNIHYSALHVFKSPKGTKTYGIQISNPLTFHQT